MAFWMDPFILLALGVVIAWLAKRLAPGNPHVTLTLGLLTMVVTYVIAIKRAGMLVTVLGGGILLGEEDFPRRLLAASVVLIGLLGIMFR